MPVKVVVTSGPSNGKSRDIDKQLIRVGTSESCELSIEGNLSKVAVNIRQTNGTFHVYNVSQVDMQLGDAILPASGSLNWSVGETLKLSSDVSLDLVESNSPKEILTPEVDIFRDNSEVDEALVEKSDSKANENVAETEELTKTGFSTQDYIYLAITVAMLIAAVFVLGYDPDKSKSKSVGPKINLVKLAEEIDNELSNAEADSERVAILRQVHANLQYLYRLQSDEGDTAKSLRVQILALASRLTTKRDAEGDPIFANSLDEKIFRFARTAVNTGT